MDGSTNKKLQESPFARGFSKFSKDYAVMFAIVLLGVIFSFSSKHFFRVDNLLNILSQTSTIAIAAIGQALVLLMGEFDLSIGQVLCVTSVFSAYLMKFMAINPVLALVLGLLLGAFIGAVNGTLIAYAKIPAFIATLGIQNIARGTSKIITNAASIGKFPNDISFLGRGFVGPIPFSVVLMITIYIIFAFITRKTRYGRNVYAIGGNIGAAYYAGIKVRKYKLLTFLIGGVMAALAGQVLMYRLDSAFITNGGLYEFDAIIASVIGGISLAGGKGKILGAMLGSTFLIMFFNGMTMLNVDAFYQDVLKGAVLIIAIGIDVIRNRTRKM